MEKLRFLAKAVFFFSFSLLLLAACQNNPSTQGTIDIFRQYYDPDKKPFYHGVASGDPLADGFIIWTRVTPSGKMDSIPVAWVVAKDSTLHQIVAHGNAFAFSERDYTLQVDVRGLEADSYYYFQFTADNKTSDIGRSKTAPTDINNLLRLAFINCTNYQSGYYNALLALAQRDSIDAVIHLGDYIYEYPSGFGSNRVDRHHLPDKELISLSDYRSRYAQYRLDKDFQEVHRMHPFICIWDDHEFANNAHRSGAKNHQPDEGDYAQRRNAAAKAYFEWLPIRENKTGQLYRKTSMGKVADLFLLDERIAGRAAPLSKQTTNSNIADSTRSMLGAEQYRWLTENMKATEAHWTLIASQVLFADMDYKTLRPDNPRNMDAWDGYLSEKRKLANFIKNNAIENLLIISGDSHCSWAFDLPASTGYHHLQTATEDNIAIELSVPSITSSNYDERMPLKEVLKIEDIYRKDNPHLKYVNLHDHGYLLLEVDSQKVLATFYYVDTVLKRQWKERKGAAFRIDSGGKGLKALLHAY